MAIRFIDTGYFKSPFVRGLNAPLKALYTFIICDCSPSGIWVADFEIASVYLGQPVTKKMFFDGFISTGKAVDLKNGKFFFPDFVLHQYPKGLQESNPAHSKIILELIENKLIKKDNKGAYKPLERVLDGTKVIVKVEDMVKETVIEGGAGGNEKKEAEPEKDQKKIELKKATDIYHKFILDITGLPAKIDGIQINALKRILAYIHSLEQIKSGSRECLETWEFILSNRPRWGKFYQDQLKISQIESNLVNLINAIKNGQPNKQTERERIKQVGDAIRKGVEIDFRPKDPTGGG